MSFGYIFDHPPDKDTRASMDIMRPGESWSFFALQGKRTASGFSTDNSNDLFLAQSVGGRAAQLKSVSDTLLQTTQDVRACRPVHLGSGGKPDYALLQGNESLCKIMDGLSGVTDLQELEGGVTLLATELGGGVVAGG